MNLCLLSEKAHNIATKSVCELLDAGFIDLYAGEMPESPDIDIAKRDDDHLARVALGSPAFAEPQLGWANIRKAVESAPARAAGMAEWFIARTKEGDPVFAGTVGTHGCDLNLNDIGLKAGTKVEVHGFRFGIGIT